MLRQELNAQVDTIYDAITAYRELLFVKAGEKKASAAAGVLLDLEDQKKTVEEKLDKYINPQFDIQTAIPGGNEDILQQWEEATLKAELERINAQIAEAEKAIDDSFNMAKEYAEKYGSDTSNDSGSDSEPEVRRPITTTSGDAERARQAPFRRDFRT